MVKEIKISALKLIIEKNKLEIFQNSPQETNYGFLMEGSIHNCFDSTQSFFRNETLHLQSHSQIKWQKQLSLIFNEHQTIASIVLVKQGLYREQLGRCQISLSQIPSILTLDLISNKKENIGVLTCVCTVKELENISLVFFKEIKCELIRDEATFKKGQPCLLFSSSKRKYRSSVKSGRLYWPETMQLFIEDQSSIKINLFDLNTSQIFFELQIKKQCFVLRKGEKKIMISNKLHYHVGCFQLQYETVGLKSQEEYERYEQIEEKLNKEMIKIYITTIKIKLKKEENQLYVKVLAGNSFIQSDKKGENVCAAEYVINDYIYVDIHELRCNFIVYSKRQTNQVLGLGVMMMDIMGFFEKRIGIIPEDSKKQIGYLIVGIRSEKVDSQKLFVRNVKLNTQHLPYDSQKIFVKMKIGGWFCRTENKPALKQIQFDKQLELRYYDEQIIRCWLMDDKYKVLSETYINLNALSNSSGSYHLLFTNSLNIYAELRFDYDLDNWKTEQKRLMQQQKEAEKIKIVSITNGHQNEMELQKQKGNKIQQGKRQQFQDKIQQKYDKKQEKGKNGKNKKQLTIITEQNHIASKNKEQLLGIKPIQEEKSYKFKLMKGQHDNKNVNSTQIKLEISNHIMDHKKMTRSSFNQKHPSQKNRSSPKKDAINQDISTNNNSYKNKSIVQIYLGTNYARSKLLKYKNSSNYLIKQHQINKSQAKKSNISPLPNNLTQNQLSLPKTKSNRKSYLKLNPHKIQNIGIYFQQTEMKTAIRKLSPIMRNKK